MKGSRRGNALLTQLRVGRSFLNYHGYSIGLTDSPACLCDRQETVEHYLLNCFLFTEERRLLLNTVEQLLPNFKNFTVKKKIDILLFGINLDIDEIDCEMLDELIVCMLVPYYSNHRYPLHNLMGTQSGVPIDFIFHFPLNNTD